MDIYISVYIISVLILKLLFKGISKKILFCVLFNLYSLLCTLVFAKFIFLYIHGLAGRNHSKISSPLSLIVKLVMYVVFL
jgi:hypothetical protein